MSDVKPPRTCGQCEHSCVFEVFCPKFNFSVPASRRACSLGEARKSSLLQRCQQLEQVALSLLGIAHGAAEEIMFPSRELIAKKRSELEALGVSTNE